MPFPMMIPPPPPRNNIPPPPPPRDDHESPSKRRRVSEEYQMPRNNPTPPPRNDPKPPPAGVTRTFTIDASSLVRDNKIEPGSVIMNIKKQLTKKRILAQVKKDLRLTTHQGMEKQSVKRFRIIISSRHCTKTMLRDILTTFLKHVHLNRSVLIRASSGTTFQLSTKKTTTNNSTDEPVEYIISCSLVARHEIVLELDNVANYISKALRYKEVTTIIEGLRIKIRCTTFIRKGTIKNIIHNYLKKRNFLTVLKSSGSDESNMYELH